MRNLFFDRMRVSIADSVGHPLAALQDPNCALASMALTDCIDVPADAKQSIEWLDRKEAIPHRAGYALRAFWSTFVHEVKPLNIVSAQLLVNPPDGLSGIAPGAWVWNTQRHLTGHYGSNVNLPVSDILVKTRIEGELNGYFDDVAVFWDYAVGPGIAEHLAPGSTLTLVRPRLDKHTFWIGWSGLELNFKSIVDEVGSVYKLSKVHSSQTDNTDLVIYGIESK